MQTRYWLVASLIGLSLSAACEQRATPQETIETADLATGVELSKPIMDAPKLAYWGDYTVGTTVLRFTDPDRPVLLELDPETGRPVQRDRILPALIWYPAVAPSGDAARAEYTRQFVQDPKWPMPDMPTTWKTSGHAIVDAEPVEGEGFPVVLFAHGWSGNDVSLAYLGENLASKGYVVVSPDLEDIRPTDPQVFELLFPRAIINRAQDIRFVAGGIEKAAANPASLFGRAANPDRMAVVGNSLGGLGALRTAGAAYNGDGEAASWIPAGLFDNQTEQTDAPLDLEIEGLDALVLIAPWGAQDGAGLFSDQALSKVTAPLLVVAGELDSIAGYEGGPRRIFDLVSAREKYLLTFENAGHALIPAVLPEVGNSYAYSVVGSRDAVWRDEALAGIQQHFLTAFLNGTLKGDETARAYLQPRVRRGRDGVWPQTGNEAPGSFAPIDADNVSHWPGFQRHRAHGLGFDYEVALPPPVAN